MPICAIAWLTAPLPPIPISLSRVDVPLSALADAGNAVATPAIAPVTTRRRSAAEVAVATSDVDADRCFGALTSHPVGGLGRCVGVSVVVAMLMPSGLQWLHLKHQAQVFLG